MGVYISDKKGKLKKVATNYSASSGESTSLAGTTWVFNSNIDSVAKNIETIPDDLNTSTWLDDSDSVFKVNLYYEGTFYYGIQIVSVDRTGTPERWGGARIDSSDAGTSITFVDGQDIADPNLIAYMNQIASKSNAGPTTPDTPPEPGGSSSGSLLMKSLIADVTFGSGTSFKISNLDIVADGGIYEIEIDIPTLTASRYFSMNIGQTITYLLTAMTGTAGSTTASKSGTYYTDSNVRGIANGSQFGPTQFKVNLYSVNDGIMFDAECPHFANTMTSSSTVKMSMYHYSGYTTESSNLNFFELTVGGTAEVSGIRIIIYKKATNTPYITEGEYYKEPI